MIRKETYDKAHDIVDILKMWDISKPDALSITRHMISIIENTADKDWSNPMAGTGMLVPGHPRYPKDDN